MRLIAAMLLLIPAFACAKTVALSCVLPALDVNGNPAQVLGVRFYADGQQIADEPTCSTTVDLAPATYNFTWAAYNSVGEAAQSLPTTFAVVPERGVPEQGSPPTVELATVDYGPPDREYFALSPSRDSIHPTISAGTRIRVWYLDGGAEVNTRGSARGRSAPFSVAWAYEDASGWTQPEQIIWN